MIVGAEIVVGRSPSREVAAAADVIERACKERGFAVHRLAEATRIDNRLCLYLSTVEDGHPLEDLLDRGVRRNAFARLDQTQYLVRSWRAGARLQVALAARSGAALVEAARFVAERIAGKQDFSHLDVQGPAYVEYE